jgi:hypothetical protein
VTTTTAAELERRRKRELDRERTSFAADLRLDLREMRVRATRVRWPNPKYAANPVAFFREVLGVDPWARQIEIIEAIRDCPRVAVSSGHKVSKSHTAAGIALWYYCSYPDARVIMSSTTARQVDQILWRELRIMRARSGRCTACKEQDPDGHLIPKPCPHSAIIDGDLGELARTGLKSEDFREIVGFTAREAEAVAGVSGRNLLYIIDEASGVPDVIFEAIEGNKAGGARSVLFGNPTRNDGEFFDAFHSKAHLYKTLRVSSEETPNVVTGRIVVPGLATREWIEEKREEWGEDSALYSVRVRGRHATHEEGKAFSLHAIASSEQRWAETPEAGRLFIGVDPAGESGMGDETALCARRGLKQLAAVQTYRGLTDEQHVARIVGLINQHALPRETPVVVVDREGPIGNKLYSSLFVLASKTPAPFDLVGVRASERAVRQPKIYERIRDELVANLAQWLRDGGAIVEDVKLEAEMHAPEWTQTVTGRLRITSKDIVRKMIGRSPDRMDALALSVWEPLSLQGAELPVEAQAVAARERDHDGGGSVAEQTFDPYGAADVWGRRS